VKRTRLTAPRPSVYYSAARRLKQLGWVALIVLVLVLAALAWSTSQIRPAASTLDPAHEALLPNGTLALVGFLNVSNPGPFPVDSVVFSTTVISPQGGVLVNATSPAISLAGASTSSVKVRLLFPLSTLKSVSFLLTQDATLPTVSRINATLGHLLTVQAVYQSNLSWGAPFYGLAVTVSNPAPGPGNSIVTNVTIGFSNHAAFAVLGTLGFVLDSANGTRCGGSTLPVDAPRGQSFSGTATVTLAAGCDPRGGSLVPTFTTSSFALSLPPEPVP
jgi:hypothetical protein